VVTTHDLAYITGADGVPVPEGSDLDVITFFVRDHGPLRGLYISEYLPEIAVAIALQHMFCRGLRIIRPRKMGQRTARHGGFV